MKRERKKRLSARDLRGLGAGQVRRVIPPAGRQRVEVRGTRRRRGDLADSHARRPNCSERRAEALPQEPGEGRGDA